MSFLNESDKKEIKEMFSQITKQVTIEYFTQEHACQYCRETKDLLTEVSAVSDKISLIINDFEKDKAKANKLGIDKIPGFALIGEKDYGIRYYGIPSGYEFGALIHTLVAVGTGETNLSASIKQELTKITKPVHIQVFVTPT
jgi:glutaredoxin-like protein